MNNVDLTEINPPEIAPDDELQPKPTNARRKLNHPGRFKKAIMSIPFLLALTNSSTATANNSSDNNESASPTPIVETIPSVIVSPTPEANNIDFIKEQIEKMGIQYDYEEERLWAQVMIDTQFPQAENKTEEKNQAMTLIEKVIDAMGKSKNIYFLDAYDSIQELQESGILEINANLDDSSMYSATMGLSIDELANNNKILLEIKFSPQSALNNPYLLNILIVHEMQHVKQWLTLLSTIPHNDLSGHSIAEKIRQSDPVEKKITNESEAYGAEYQAFTFFAGQTNYFVDNYNTGEAAKLISCDFDPKSLCWKSYFPANDPRVQINNKEDQ